MRRKIIAGNWKMNLTCRDSEKLAKEISANLNKILLQRVDVIVCPAFVSLDAVNRVIKDSGIKLGAQNVYFEIDGAYTGEISSSMLSSVGCEYVITGHSERRKFLHETNKIINKKINKAIESSLNVIFCVGESLEEREDDIYERVIEDQLLEGLHDIPKEQMNKIVIAYEPVWAIGTGLNASAKQISEMHMFIGKIISGLYDSEVSNNMQILYGGSVNGKNSKEILSACGVDGALIGGASLKANEFNDIINTAAAI